MLDFDLNSNSLNKLGFGLEFPVELSENYSPVLKKYWGDVISDPKEWFLAVQDEAIKIGADFVSVYFNAQEPSDDMKNELLANYKRIFKFILDNSKINLMIKLSSNAKWDCEVFCALSEIIDRELIISPIQATNYEKILKVALNSRYKHKFVLRTPIDINLTKELNILSIDSGLKAEQILIDPDMGCIGYGIDYGYSIIERICLARQAGDKMLDMPIIVYAGEESYKAKESKSDDYSSSWGELENRAKMWEISTSSALIAAGANIVVCWHPEVLKVIKQQFCEVLCH